MLRRVFSGSARGFTLVEQIIALALVAIAVTALLQSLSGGVASMRRFSDRARLIDLARSQMESIHNQAYQDLAASYSRLSLPPDFNMNIEASPPRTYTYPSPDVAQTANVVQRITITVYTSENSFQLVGYKARR